MISIAVLKLLSSMFESLGVTIKIKVHLNQIVVLLKGAPGVEVDVSTVGSI